MTTSSTPSQAARRLQPAVGGNAALDRLCALSARLLSTGSAQVALVSEVVTVAGGAGLDPGTVGSVTRAADELCTIAVATCRPLRVSHAAADPRVAALPPVTSGAVGSYLGVPLLDGDGQALGALCVSDRARREWSDGDVALLEQLATAVVAELELTALSGEHETSQVLWELAISAAGIGTFDWDLVTGSLRWDDQLVALFGYDRAGFDETIEAFNARLHPDDLPRVTQALTQSIDTAGSYQAEFRVLLPDGGTRWVDARGQALRGRDGSVVRLLGAAYDTTAVHEGEARVTRVLEAMTAAFISLDREWRFTYVNAEAERLLGKPRGELLGGDLWELFPAALDSEFETHYRGAAASGRQTSFQAYYPPPLDAWYEVRAWPSPDGLSVYFLDVTERLSAQRAAAEATARATLLADVTQELTDTLDTEEAVGRLAQLLVPTLGDWCIVTLVGEQEHADWRRRLRDVGSWHADPELRPVVEEYQHLRLAALAEDSFLSRAARTSRPIVVPSGATARIWEVLAPGRARDLLTRLAPESFSVLPLRGRGQTVGIVTLFNGPDRGPLSPQDLQTARGVADRAGLALDNARLYQQQRRLAEGLQRALLTEPPEPDHVQVVVRYEPAAAIAQVGGDWYDAFLQRDGGTVLVIGDVIGHDTAAAAAMGQVRGLLRGIGADSGAGPAELLGRVDRVLQTLLVETTATAVVARLEQTADERERGVTRLRWSNAGHPPPMVVNPDGSTATLAAVDADLLLGIDPTSRRHEAVATLDRGATVLLYTDGLVERRGQTLDDGLDLLQDTLAELAAADLPLEELCDGVLRRMLPARPEDDVALVAVRLHRQDRPRPVEAGPARVPDDVAPEQGVVT